MTPDVFIKAIRDSFVGAEQVYTQGSCIMFYRILKLVFPEASPYWSKEVNHLIVKIGDEYWDITGKIEDTTGYELANTESYSRISLAVALPKKKVAHKKFPTKQKP